MKGTNKQKKKRFGIKSEAGKQVEVFFARFSAPLLISYGLVHGDYLEDVGVKLEVLVDETVVEAPTEVVGD